MTKLASLIEDLGRANQRLKEAVALQPTRIHKDATIQRFEFTFELAWKTLQAYLADQGLDAASPKRAIREAARLGVLDDVATWFDFLERRNLIAHSYTEELADQIYEQARAFPTAVAGLLEKVSQHVA